MKTLNVYINGTNQSNRLGSISSLANVLHAMTIQDENQSSWCIEGCGINNPDSRDFGAIFTFYLEIQVNKIVDDIKNILISLNEKLVLNLYGFSRGGAAVFWICKKLKDIQPDLIEINVASFEPVPGNFVRSSYIDNVSGATTTLSSRIADLSDCKNINKMLVLFTNIPLDDIACHAPLLPIKPASASMIVDVVPGCHAGAQFFNITSEKWLNAYNHESALTFHYVTDFLKDCNTQFNQERFVFSPVLRSSQKEAIRTLLPHLNDKLQQTKRSMHFYNEIRTNPEGQYLNLTHKKLVTNQENADASNCILSVKDPAPRASFYNGQASFGSYFAPLVLFSTAGFAAATGNPVTAASSAATGSYLMAQRPQ